MKIIKIHARQILDSRGNPTVEADVILEDGTLGRAAVPSGASTGTHEAVELRDNDPKLYAGKSVLKAVSNVNTEIADALTGMEVTSQKEIDQKMIDLDGTNNKGHLGANAILAISLACAHAASSSLKLPLFQYFHTLSAISHPPTLPLPMMNIINGGKHADGSSDIQEFMIMPIGAKTFSRALQMGAEVFHSLGNILKQNGYQTTVGDEGGYAPSLASKTSNGNTEALQLIKKAVEKAGYSLGEDIVLGLDIAASELYKDGIYTLKTNNWELDSKGMVDALIKYCDQFPIKSIEDGLAENDWEGWVNLTKKIGDRIQIVGDDLLVTNTKFLEKAINEKAANAILIKVNQIGTLTETIQAIEMAHQAGWKAIVSHRSGETEDTTIAHLVVGLGTGQIKTGSLSRSDRTAKYNELLRIEESLGEKATFAGKNALDRKS